MKENASGDETEMWRTTVHRHFLRGPSGAIGSTTTRTRTNPDLGSRMNIPDHSRVFKQFFGLKIRKIFDADSDPGTF
jgi:hypothetical protein